MTEEIPPTPEAFQEAFELSDEILKDIEVSRASLTVIALKASRLARLLNHQEGQQIFQHEASGYPSTPEGVPPDIWKLLESAGRIFLTKGEKKADLKPLGMLESIEELEQKIEAGRIALQAAQDRDVSVSSANPNQFVMPHFGNAREREKLLASISEATKKIAGRRAFIYQYASRRHYELKFSGAAQNVFSAVRKTVDQDIGEVVPGSVQKFASVHDNLRSQNPEDWSNAVHSCRRILQELADAIFPPQPEDRVLGNGTRIKLGPDNYINRLVCFVDDSATSARFSEIVGSNLHYIGDRFDAIFKAAQKGSHGIVTQEEANRYVVYTYMIVGDVLALRRTVQEKKLT